MKIVQKIRASGRASYKKMILESDTLCLVAQYACQYPAFLEQLCRICKEWARSLGEASIWLLPLILKNYWNRRLRFSEFELCVNMVQYVLKDGQWTRLELTDGENTCSISSAHIMPTKRALASDGTVYVSKSANNLEPVLFPNGARIAILEKSSNTRFAISRSGILFESIG